MTLPLPSPTFSFTIPSVYDATALDCRLYLPNWEQQQRPERESDTTGSTGAIANTTTTTTTRACPKGAIMAHPYAPLGGCYDDPVVSVIGAELLHAGYVLGTFNFRGAPGSDGRTSWTARPELADYVSFYGFMVYYLHGLLRKTAPPPPLFLSAGGFAPGVPIANDEVSLPSSTSTKILLGGYSYGSMIASHQPTVDVLLRLFADCSPGSLTGVIRSKAKDLATASILGKELNRRNQKKERLQTMGRSSTFHPLLTSSDKGDGSNLRTFPHSYPLTTPTSDNDPATQTGSHNVSQQATTKKEQEDDLPATPSVAYLLVSPILPPISHFVTLFSRTSLMSGTNPGISIWNHKLIETPVPCPRPEEQLCAHPTLVIYGNRDMFSHPKKLQKWAKDLTREPPSSVASPTDSTTSLFQSREIDGAGHFWAESGVETQLRHAVREWVCCEFMGLSC